MDAITKVHDGDVQMIDSFGPCIFIRSRARLRIFLIGFTITATLYRWSDLTECRGDQAASKSRTELFIGPRHHDMMGEIYDV
jgi:hypothetical protein